MKVKDLSEKLLLAILQEHRNLPDDEEEMDIALESILETGKISARKRDVVLCLKDFASHNLIELEELPGEPEETFYNVRMTYAGMIEAEALEERMTPTSISATEPTGLTLDGSATVAQPEASTAPNSTTFGFATDSAPYGSGTFADPVSVPAANRYVSARDNQPLIKELREKIAALTNAVSENRENDFDDKEGRLAELAALDLILSKPQISVPLVEKILSDTVKYLAKRFADTAIGQIAVEVLKLAASALWT